MAGISDQEKKTILNFIERNVKRGPNPHFPDEGIGTVYERIVIDEYLAQIQAKYHLNRILETPADGVTGVPGINSLVFAQNGAHVTLVNPSELMLKNAKVVWKNKKLLDKVEFVKAEIDQLPFPDKSFDLVWNYCMFERFAEPEALVKIMKRVSKKYVMIMTQNCWNLGTAVHWIYHKLCRLEWDHGFAGNMRINAIQKTLAKCGLDEIERGTIDTPPWLDTWDMPLRGELKNLLAVAGKKWEWKTQSGESRSPSLKKQSPSRLINICVWIEKNLPLWFSYAQTHHLYILAKQK